MPATSFSEQTSYDQLKEPGKPPGECQDEDRRPTWNPDPAARIVLLQGAFGYAHLGHWKDREGNRNIERLQLAEYVRWVKLEAGS